MQYRPQNLKGCDKLKTSKICEVFSLFADISTDEAIKYMPIIYANKKNIEENLKDKTYAEEYSYELELLCGAKVYYEYLLTKRNDNASRQSSSSAKVGGVSMSESSKENIKLSDNVRYAKELCAKYELLATNLFVDKYFLFGSV